MSSDELERRVSCAFRESGLAVANLLLGFTVASVEIFDPGSNPNGHAA
jgi:hypothetical protein